MIASLVVVAIITLLIAILLPSLGRARERGNTTKCLANLKSLALGVAVYALLYLAWDGLGPRDVTPPLAEGGRLVDEEIQMTETPILEGGTATVTGSMWKGYSITTS